MKPGRVFSNYEQLFLNATIFSIAYIFKNTSTVWIHEESLESWFFLISKKIRKYENKKCENMIKKQQENEKKSGQNLPEGY